MTATQPWVHHGVSLVPSTGAPARLFPENDPRGPCWRIEAYEQQLPLSDHECAHGRLVGDSSPACGCWAGEPVHELVADLITRARERTTMHPFDPYNQHDPSPDPNVVGELAESHDPTETILTEELDFGRDFIQPDREFLRSIGVLK